MNPSIREGLETLAERGAPRGADAVLGSAQQSVRRRQRWLQGGFVAVVLLLVGASVGAYIIADRGDGSSTGVATEPDQPAQPRQPGLTTPDPGDRSEPPDEIDGVSAPLPDVSPWMVWISEPVVPAGGADVVLAVRSTAGGDATFGVTVEIDQWNGEFWVRRFVGATCVHEWNCVGEIARGDPPPVEDIGLAVPAGGTGPAEWLRIDGLEPGWYRVRKSTHEGAEAIGQFAVVETAVPLVDVGPASDVARIDVTPPVVAPRGGSIGVLAELPGSETIVTESLQRWDGDAWVDLDDTLEPSFNGMSIQILNTANFGPRRLPELDPGVHRIVWSVTDGSTAVGVFWVDDGRDPTRMENGDLVLDGGRLVAAGFPADFRPRTMPRSFTTPLGRDRSSWDFASREQQAAVSISVERGAGATEALATYSVVDGVTRQGAVVYRADDPGVPLPRPIGWPPAPDVVIWLGTNSAEIDLVTLSEGIRYEDPPPR